jgi:hypothetical protein
MNLALDELLTLAGRLDDVPGFDSGRERFRRFLLDRVTAAAAVQGLVDDCQRSVGEQRHRALHDLIVLAGRPLGFEVAFGSYEPPKIDEVALAGRWRSPEGIDVILEIRTERSAPGTLEGLARAVAESCDASRLDRHSDAGLCVVARHHVSRAELSAAANAQFPNVHIVSVRGLMALVAQASDGRISHAALVTLLRSRFALDPAIEALRASSVEAGELAGEQAADASRELSSGQHAPSFWVATIAASDVPQPEHLLTSMILRRHVLAICDAGAIRGEGSPGDWVCFFLPAKGIVGHAQLAEVVEDGGRVVRNAAQFSRVYRLEHVTAYNEPVVQALRGERPFAIPPAGTFLAGPCLAPIARQDFLAMTTAGQPSGV